jgi:Colon cancer-associated protein Mic1-like
MKRCQEEKMACSQIFLRTKAVAKVCIKQSDMLDSVLSKISDPKQREYVLLVYLDSLASHAIPLRHKLSWFVVQTLVIRRNLTTLDLLLRQQTIQDSHLLVDCLLAWYKTEQNPQYLQLALDMLARMDSHEVSRRVRDDE